MPHPSSECEEIGDLLGTKDSFPFSITRETNIEITLIDFRSRAIHFKKHAVYNLKDGMFYCQKLIF